MTMLLSLVLAGAAAVPAMPVEARTWFTSKEHPKTALAVAQRGHIAYKITVSPDGKALRCETREDTELDRKVCEILMKSARFVPAKDDAGQTVFGVHEGVASFLMPGKDRQRPDSSKLTVTIDKLPDGATSPAFASVAFLVDGAGTISRCASTPGERRRSQQSVAALGPAACENLARDYHPAPARNDAGVTVPSVQTATVRFQSH